MNILNIERYLFLNLYVYSLCLVLFSTQNEFEALYPNISYKSPYEQCIMLDSNTFGREEVIPFETWEGRLKIPLARTFIVVERVPFALAESDPQELQTSLNHLGTMPWASMGVLAVPKLYEGNAVTTSTSSWNIYHPSQITPGAYTAERNNVNIIKSLL
jgi:hypothetical protein